MTFAKTCLAVCGAAIFLTQSESRQLCGLEVQYRGFNPIEALQTIQERQFQEFEQFKDTLSQLKFKLQTDDYFAWKRCLSEYEKEKLRYLESVEKYKSSFNGLVQNLASRKLDAALYEVELQKIFQQFQTQFTPTVTLFKTNIKYLYDTIRDDNRRKKWWSTVKTTEEVTTSDGKTTRTATTQIDSGIGKKRTESIIKKSQTVSSSSGYDGQSTEGINLSNTQTRSSLKEAYSTSGSGSYKASSGNYKTSSGGYRRKRRTLGVGVGVGVSVGVGVGVGTGGLGKLHRHRLRHGKSGYRDQEGSGEQSMRNSVGGNGGGSGVGNGGNGGYGGNSGNGGGNGGIGGGSGDYGGNGALRGGSGGGNGGIGGGSGGYGGNGGLGGGSGGGNGGIGGNGGGSGRGNDGLGGGSGVGNSGYGGNAGLGGSSGAGTGDLSNQGAGYVPSQNY
ncbi:hypothetical protein WDU94_011651 [Cyamophila willieti]